MWIAGDGKLSEVDFTRRLPVQRASSDLMFPKIHSSSPATERKEQGFMEGFWRPTQAGCEALGAFDAWPRLRCDYLAYNAWITRMLSSGRPS